MTRTLRWMLRRLQFALGESIVMSVGDEADMSVAALLVLFSFCRVETDFESVNRCSATPFLLFAGHRPDMLGRKHCPCGRLFLEYRVDVAFWPVAPLRESCPG